MFRKCLTLKRRGCFIENVDQGSAGEDILECYIYLVKKGGLNKYICGFKLKFHHQLSEHQNKMKLENVAFIGYNLT